MFKKNLSADRQDSKGFTLIELLVVIAIIGILSSVVLASLNSARKKGRDARRVSDIMQIRTAFELFFDSCRQYPSTLLTTASNGCPVGTTLGTFINVIPTPPSGGGQVAYAYEGGPAGCTNYHLGASLEDTTNSALASDATAVSIGAACGGTVFNGDAANCIGAVAAGTDNCYNAKP